MHPLRLPILILSLASLAACNRNEKFSSPLWFYQNSEDPTQHLDSLLTRISYLDLEPDGNYTMDLDRFDYGTWTLKGRELYLTNHRHTTYIYQVPVNGKNTLLIKLEKNGVALFHNKPRPSADSTRNPFSLANNRWRIRATHNETIEEIRQRLLNHLHFWEEYFKWDDDNNVGIMDVRDVPTPLKIYGNGFGLKHYRDLSPKWIDCFFDTVNCHSADTLIKGAFRRNKIDWPKSDDETKLFISGIQQVQAFLRKE